jgi:hypothetical protein
MTTSSTHSLFVWIRPLAAIVLLAAIAGDSHAAVYVTIDGRDAANLAGDGNHAPFHNPPVNFAFTFGGVMADNLDAGPGDPPGPTETDFNVTGNGFGGMGFGTASAGDSTFPSTAYFRMVYTVNRANTLASLDLNLKDADTLSPVQVHLIEEHQYPIALGALGLHEVWLPLNAPTLTNTPRDGVPNFDPGNGLTELQLQYPFSADGTGAILDITVHKIEIRDIPEPATLPLAIGALGAGCLRRGRSRKRAGSA